MPKVVQYIWKPSWRRWLIRWVWKNRFGFFSILKIQWLRWGGSVLSRHNHVWGVWETQGSYDCSFRKREQVSLQRLGVRSAALKDFAMRGSLHLILRTTKGEPVGFKEIQYDDDTMCVHKQKQKQTHRHKK